MDAEADDGLAFGGFAVEETLEAVFEETSQEIVQVVQEGGEIKPFAFCLYEKLLLVGQAEDKPAVEFLEKHLEHQQEALLSLDTVRQVEAVPNVPKSLRVHRQRLGDRLDWLLGFVFAQQQEMFRWHAVVLGQGLRELRDELQACLLVLMEKTPVGLVNLYQFVEFGHSIRLPFQGLKCVKVKMFFRLAVDLRQQRGECRR